MILNGYTIPTRCVSLKPRHASSTPRLQCKSFIPPASLQLDNNTLAEARPPPSRFLCGDRGSLLRAVPTVQRRHEGRGARSPPQAAAKDAYLGFKFPAMTRRPRWWWRVVACLPYLMPLHEAWMFAETVRHLHYFVKVLQRWSYPFLIVIGGLPRWFLIAYFIVLYLGVVRRKEWPHFVRFHVVIGMLLEIFLQVLGIMSRWLPTSIYWGSLGRHFWCFIMFAFLFTVLECIRCALSGMYADVPFFCEAAYIQIPFD